MKREIKCTEEYERVTNIGRAGALDRVAIAFSGWLIGKF